MAEIIKAVVGPAFPLPTPGCPTLIPPPHRLSKRPSLDPSVVGRQRQTDRAGERHRDGGREQRFICTASPNSTPVVPDQRHGSRRIRLKGFCRVKALTGLMIVYINLKNFCRYSARDKLSRGVCVVCVYYYCVACARDNRW